MLAETKRGIHKIFVTVVVIPHYRAFNERYQLTEVIGDRTRQRRARASQRPCNGYTTRSPVRTRRGFTWRMATTANAASCR